MFSSFFFLRPKRLSSRNHDELSLSRSLSRVIPERENEPYDDPRTLSFTNVGDLIPGDS